MYPLDDPVLTFGDIARHWSREQLQGTSPDEVLDRLLSAFWQGDLDAMPSKDPDRRLADPRSTILEIVSRLDDHPSLLIIRPGAEVEPVSVEHPDGSSTIDLRIRVPWPPSEDSSVPEAREAAYASLATADFASYSPVIAPGLHGLHVEREAFGSFCAERWLSKSKQVLGVQISRTVFAHTGLKVNAHLFRHIGAKLYLDAMPGSYEVMRRVLGHKAMDTTTRFYAGMETKAAVRHFDDVILKRQIVAAAASARKKVA